MDEQETLTTVRTESGSTYRFRKDAEGRFWVSGDNLVTAQSQSLSGGEWEVAQPAPWPPERGHLVRFFPTPELDALPHEDPRRCPGGGKYTSPVVDVVEEA